MSRPLFYSTINQLSAQVGRNLRNDAELALVEAELNYRESKAAKELLQFIKSTRAGLKPDSRPSAKPSQQPKPPKSSKPAKSPIKSAEVVADVLPPSSTAKAEPMIDDQRRWTEEAVASLRRKLLDLGKKNPLISYKHSSRGGSHLRIVDERPDLLLEALNDGTMEFEPLPGEEVTPVDERTAEFQIAYERGRLTDEQYLAATDNLGEHEDDARAWQEAERALRKVIRSQLGLPPIEYGKSIDVIALARAHGFDPSYDLKNSDEPLDDHHQDNHIRVLFTRNELEKQTKKIWEKYKSHARETGLHTLFLVFGFVQWYEDDSSDIALHAPLLLQSVELDRKAKGGRYDYSLTTHGETLQVNVALAEKMRENFGLELPQLRENETPESYFIRTAEVLAKGNRLSLRRFVTLAVLPFPRMVLWKDLDPALWAEGAFSEHPLLPMLLRAKSSGGGSTKMGETHDIDSEEWATKAPALIALADASQHSALIDVAAGKSIAIEGPPGTGKSQTITNMIAGALDAGKKVLFIAEKQAALSVVAARLRERGFGPLLLELHSDNTNRNSLYESLRQRLKASSKYNGDELQSKREQLQKQRQIIRRYLSLIGTNLGSLGRDAYWLVWREIGLRSKFAPAVALEFRKHFQPENFEAITGIEIDEVRSKLDVFAKQLMEIEATREDGQRTRWINAKILPSFEQSAQLSAAKAVAKGASDMSAASYDITSIAQLNLPTPSDDLSAAEMQLSQVEQFGILEEPVMVSAINHPEQSRALLARQFRWRQLCDQLRNDIVAPGNVPGPKLAELTDSLATLDEIPTSVVDLNARMAALESIIFETGTADDGISDLIEALITTKSVSINQAAGMARAIIELSDASDLVAALYDEKLIEPLATITIDREKAKAIELIDERDNLSHDVKNEAFQLSLGELEELAQTLEQSGIFSRVVGSQYREAKRKATRLISAAFNREEAVLTLRRTSSYVSRSKIFFDESVARTLFPATLWQGITSDWFAIEDAKARLKSASDVLAENRCNDSLRRWLEAPSRERQRISNAAKASVHVLQLASTWGLGNESVADVSSKATIQLDQLKRASTALIEVGCTAAALIVRDGEPISTHLAAIDTANDGFLALTRGDTFGWVGSIAEPLDNLARAMAAVEQLEATYDPLGLANALKSTEAPIATMAKIVELKTNWLTAASTWRKSCDLFQDAVGLDAVEFAPKTNAWSDLSTRFSAIGNDIEGARLAASLLRYASTLNEVGCAPFVEHSLAGTIPVNCVADLYELTVVRHLLDHYLGADGSELASLGSLTVDAARKSFIKIDKLLHELEANAIVSKRLGDKPPMGTDYGPKSNWTEQSLLDNELSLRRPRTPIRDVTHRAGRALQALKPVWMMSPASAAQYIRAGGLVFDLLVVDEASQMRPEYAVSSILRGDQFVVVGDTNQLPPTDVFSVSTDSDDDGFNDDGSPETMSVNTESILDLANERFRNRRRLKWHYRSQHESLIQFSNRQFYDRDLVVFPSPTTDDDLLGVKHRFVEGATYEASINQKEAEAVIEEAFGLMRAYPQYSMGIATMNAKQAELIQSEFDRLILESPEVRKYVDAHAGGVEEFFIKNLENVQGDERDIIIISTVYGPSKEGVVVQRFGLMNREVGWRRLNVLVTRAKLSTRLITSLRSNDIKITPTTSKGPIAFQAYLNYAENGAQFDDASGGVEDSDFEVFVGDALRAAGYEVIPQVGVEGFRIDLGVRHADCPGGFIAGVECDGARYHSGLSVRDRDRIRQSILEGLGWNIYRVWSTDWFQDPGRETAKLLAALELIKLRKTRLQTDLSNAEVDGAFSTAVSIAAPPTLFPPLETATVDSTIVGDVDADIEFLDEPTGKQMPNLDDIEWYETEPKRVYELWDTDRKLGNVVVLSRPIAGPQKLYGGQVRVALPEYQGNVVATGDSFIKHDIYAAVREVARRARSV